MESSVPPTRVVNLRKETFDIYIGRGGNSIAGQFGNPFSIGPDGNRRQVIAKYRTYFEGRVTSDSVFRAHVKSLKGKILGCYCKPNPCHGDVIKEWLDGN